MSGLTQVGCATTLPHSSAFRPLKNDDRSTISPGSPTTQTVHLSPPYSPATSTFRNQLQRPESFLFRAAVRDETNQGHSSPLLSSSTSTTESADPRSRQNSKQREEELELIDQLRKNIEFRLKVSLPCDLGAALTDGVVLCHLANHVRPRSVPSIHVPSPAVPKLTMAKCRRNVENFLEACRKIGVPQERLCLPLHILEEKGLTQVAVTVQALLELAPPKQQQHQLSAV